jgi:hypothetical protein
VSVSCRECGLQLSEGARFCRACGTPVTGEQPVATGPRPDPDGGYWAAVGRAGAERTGGERAGGTPAATAVAPPPPAGPTYVAASPAPAGPPSRRTGLIVAAVVGALVVLALAALVGYELTRQDADDGQGAGSPTSAPVSSGPQGAAVLHPGSVDASCTGADSRDAAGNVTSYGATRAVDGDEATAWRCDDDGIGQSLQIRFDKAVHLVSVGLIPGIVKVDPADGTDRFVQNNKIAKVRWVFDGGKAATQSFEPRPDLQHTPVDVTTRTVTVEIQSVFPGKDTPNDDGKDQKATGKSPIAEIELRGTP